MIKRISTTLLTLILLSLSSWANQEEHIVLERGAVTPTTVQLPYGILTIRLTEYAGRNQVGVSIENTTTSQALILSRNSHGEKDLKKNKPKIEFEKTYPGSKGKRSLYGFNELIQPLIVITPEEKENLFTQFIGNTAPVKVEIPIYLAKYDSKQLVKKGPSKINYKILSEDILTLNIELKGWSEKDPDYIAAKKAVDEYLHSLKAVAFCKNKKHDPSLAEQQRPYIEKKDSLIDVINSTLNAHQEWISTDKPHIAYAKLLSSLNEVNLNDKNYDCGNHKAVGKKQHSCSYCSLSTQQIYHQLDDLFQQLHSGKITKEEAVKKAKGLYSCYQSSTKRKKDSFYSGKISGFYNRIVK